MALFKRTSIVLGAAASLLAVTSTYAQPNILLVIADDMGLDASRCYNVGKQQANMPVLEAMCAQGKVFENAYAAPTCSPTRASIMTGKHGFRVGVGGAIPKRGNFTGVSSNEYSLFDALAKSNYASAVVGKWHIAGAQDGFNHPASLGVKEYFGLYNGGVKDYSNWDGVHNGKVVPVNTYATTALTNHAIDWVSQQTTPWFLWLAYNAPHTPFHLPPQNLHSTGNLPSDDASIKANPVPYYNAMLEALDTELGRLLASLSKDVRDNTIVMFLGDNGSPSSISRSIYGPRRNKGSIYQGGTNVPFVVSGPGISKGRTDALMNTSDLFATISSLAGVPAQATDSVNFSSVLNGGSGARQFAYAEHFGNNQRRPDVFGWAVRNARYKLVEEQGEAQELYDLANDPLEKNDLLAGTLDAAQSAQLKSLQQTYSNLHKAQ
ncbi:sulfatase [Leucothrix sargassi]|nr:sulfatase [Leucothrix sargassi]